METEGNKMLRNVKMLWISMRSLAQRIMVEYTMLLVEMDRDMTSGLGHKTCARVAVNFDLPVDIEVLLSLTLFIPLVNAVHALIKLSQAKDILVFDLMQGIRLCQSKLIRLFIERDSIFTKDNFLAYNDLIFVQSKHIPL